MTAHPILVAVAIGYAFGSIPFGYMLVRLFTGADVRTTGSGNIGATNVARTSPALGLATLVLDAAKGMGAVALVMLSFPDSRGLAFMAAFSAICGHVFSVWLGFRGGKGVATGLGSLLLLTPKAILIGAGIFLALVAAFRWVALASIAATAILPLAAWLTGETRHEAIPDSQSLPRLIASPLLWTVAAALLIVLKHRSNIRRLLAGTEPRFQIRHS